MLARSIRIRDLVILVIAINKILQDGARLKNANLFTVKSVGDGGDAAVGVDLKEPRLLLLVLAHLDGVHLVVEAELLKQDGGLDAIGCTHGVEGDVCLCLGSHVEELFTELSDA